MATITASPHTVDGGDRRMAGAGIMLAGVAAFVALEATAKWLGADYPTSQVVFVRTTLGALFALALVPALGGWRTLALTRPLVHVGRGGLLVLAQYTYFAGLRHLGLPEATALSFSVPLFVAALSVPLLGERVGVSRWAAVLVGFAGVGVVLRPTPASFESAGLLILVAALAYALALLVTRRVAAAQPVGAQVVYGQAVAAAFSALMLVPGDWTSPTTPGDLGLFALLGLLGTANFAFITAAFRLAPAPTCAPLYYTAIVWSTLLGWLLWGDTLDALTWAGTAIVIACGLKVVTDEHRKPHSSSLHRQHSRSSPTTTSPPLNDSATKSTSPSATPANTPASSTPRPTSAGQTDTHCRRSPHPASQPGSANSPRDYRSSRCAPSLVAQPGPGTGLAIRWGHRLRASSTCSIHTADANPGGHEVRPGERGGCGASKLSATQEAHLMTLYWNGEHTVSELAESLPSCGR